MDRKRIISGVIVGAILVGIGFFFLKPAGFNNRGKLNHLKSRDQKPLILPANDGTQKEKHKIKEYASMMGDKQEAKEIGRDGNFIAYDNGVVYDTRTGLEWFVGPDKNTNWKTAKSWVENLDAAGGDWRMPSTEELQTLFKKGAGENNMTPLLKSRGWFVWSGETGKIKGLFWSRWEAGCFDFNFNGVASRELRWFSSLFRAFAVRVRYAETLVTAAYQGNLDVLKTLFEKGADVNAKDHDGYTPLMMAAINGQYDVVKLLIDYGVDINAKQKDGKTALSFASAKGFGGIVNLLRKYGAEE
jgi:hypothetical protein